jgi:hypothetical protein
MKNPDFVTLNADQSRQLRALAHAIGCLSVEELLHELIFSISPKNHLDNLIPGALEFTAEEERRIAEASRLAGNYPDELGWHEFAEVAEKMPSFDPVDYPRPAPVNVIEIGPHLYLEK